MDLSPLLVPLVHRYLPTVGPGALAGTFGLLLRADTRHMVHVTRHADVVEVLERPDVFSVRRFGERMEQTTGPFVLGTVDPVRHDQEAALLRVAIRREDVSRIRALAAEETADAIARVRAAGSIDLVKQLADIVPMRVAMRYFGLVGESQAKLLPLFQQTSWYVFSFWYDRAMRARAERAAVQLNGILERVVAARRGSSLPEIDDVLGRLLAVSGQFADGDGGVVRSLAGLISGALNAPGTLFVNAVDKLLSVDAETDGSVRQLAQAAHAGDAEARATFLSYLVEAQRFNVFPGVLSRRAEQTVRLAAGTSREKQIAQGTEVVTWPSLAAFDSEVYQRPFAFEPGRSAPKLTAFGWGRHACLGTHIGQPLLEEMARALFVLPGLRRAPGKPGKLQRRAFQDAKTPLSLSLRFER